MKDDLVQITDGDLRLIALAVGYRKFLPAPPDACAMVGDMEGLPTWMRGKETDRA